MAGVPHSGPCPADIMIVGEAPDHEAVRLGRPFLGQAGALFTDLLGKAGIDRNVCFLTNVARHRPYGGKIDYFLPKKKKDITPRHDKLIYGKVCSWEIEEGIDLLKREIALARPKLIIACGETALWTLTGNEGISKWRGSRLNLRDDLWGSAIDFGKPPTVLATFHPVALLRNPSLKLVMLNDLKRVNEYAHSSDDSDKFDIITRPDIDIALSFLSSISTRLEAGERLPLAIDIETKGGAIDCIGIAISPTVALCIPLMYEGYSFSYWTEEEEIAIFQALKFIFTHPNMIGIGQNFVYDAQFFHCFFCYIPNLRHAHGQDDGHSVSC